MAFLETVKKAIWSLLTFWRPKKVSGQTNSKAYAGMTFDWQEGAKLQADDEPHWRIKISTNKPIKIYPPADKRKSWVAVIGEHDWSAYFEGSENEVFSKAVEWATPKQPKLTPLKI